MAHPVGTGSAMEESKIVAVWLLPVQRQSPSVAWSDTQYHSNMTLFRADSYSEISQSSFCNYFFVIGRYLTISRIYAVGMKAAGILRRSYWLANDGTHQEIWNPISESYTKWKALHAYGGGQEEDQKVNVIFKTQLR